jgi:hypothetical protein
MTNFNLLQLIWPTRPTNIIITRLIKYIVAIVGNIIKGIININYKIIVEVLMKVYFEAIIKRSVIFIRS